MDKTRVKSPITTAFLGGSFNPIHIGHLTLADQVCNGLELKRIYFVPAYISPFKPEILQVSPSQRLEMIELAIQDNDKFSVLDWELESKSPSFTITTVIKAMETFSLKPKELGIVIGMDNVTDLEKWHRFSELCPLVTWIIALRPNSEKLTIPQYWINRWNFSWLQINNPKLEISSSYIREQIQNHHGYRYLLPPKVHHYILSHNLYG